MLTYLRVRSAFESNHALPSDKIKAFKVSFTFFNALRFALSPLRLSTLYLIPCTYPLLAMLNREIHFLTLEIIPEFV